MAGRHGTLAERFWRYVEKAEGCWRWTGALHKGYGRIRSGTHGEPILGAHQASWVIHNGPIPAGLHVLHHCDTPACVRPNHLYLGTESDNKRDMHARGRARGRQRGTSSRDERGRFVSVA